MGKGNLDLDWLKSKFKEFKTKLGKTFDILNSLSAKNKNLAPLFPIILTFSIFRVNSIPVDQAQTFLLNLFSGLTANALTKVYEKFSKKDILKISEEDLKNILEEIEKLSTKNIETNKDLLNFGKKLLKEIDELKDLLAIEERIEERITVIEKEIEFLKKLNIPKVENLLEKGAEKQPELFRKSGPIWIDFEKGYIYEREEVKEIIEKMSENEIIVIKGKPASGKSVVLRNVGYHLVKKNWSVFYIPLKIIGNIPNFNRLSHGVVIVDDAHLNIELTESLILNKNKKVKLIIGTRDIDVEEVRGPTNELKFSEYLDNAITIEAKTIADELINNIYEEKILKDSLPYKIKNKLNKNNLWILSWQLKTYEIYNNLDETNFYKTVKNYIDNLDSSHVENIILPLSIFYKYEIPVRKGFLNEFFSNEDIESKVKALLKVNEIVSFMDREGNDYLALHHSETAKIYFETFNNLKDFGYNIKEKIKEISEKYGIDDSDQFYMDIALLIHYTKKFPEEFNNFIGKVEENIQDKLLHNKKFLLLTPDIFEKMKPLRDFESYLFYRDRLIPRIKNTGIKQKIYKMKPKVFEEKIRGWDENPPFWWGKEDVRNHIKYLEEILKEVNYPYLNEVKKTLKRDNLWFLD